LAGLDNISEIDVALRTMSGGIKQYENKTRAKQVLKLYEEHNIINPWDEGHIPHFRESSFNMH